MKLSADMIQKNSRPVCANDAMQKPLCVQIYWYTYDMTRKDPQKSIARCPSIARKVVMSSIPSIAHGFEEDF